MIDWFTEDSTLPMVTGVILALIFFGFAFVSREKMMFYAAIVISCLTAGTVICERWIVTDREEVVARISELAEMVESNNMAGVVSAVSKSRPDTIESVKAEMPNNDFESCRVIGTDYFKCDAEANPKSAEISFVVTARVRRVNRPELFHGPRKVTLNFEKEADGQWRIIKYEHSSPQHGLKL